MLRRIKLYQNLIIKQNKMKIGFIGSGKMAEAILSGILDSKIMSSKDIYCSDINIERTEEALSLNPNINATGCPFCNTMMTDGIKYLTEGNTTEVLDVAELIADHI